MTRSGALGLAGLLLSAALLIGLGLGLDLGEVKDAIASAKTAPLLLGGAIYSTLFLLRGLRWSLLLAPVAPVSVRQSTEAFLVGFMANNLLPARLGDLVRAFVLARTARTPAAASVATVLLERVFDGITVVFVLALGLTFARFGAGGGDEPLRAVAVAMAAVFGGALAVATSLAIAESAALRWFAAVLRPERGGIGAHAHRLLARLAQGLRVLRDRRRTAAVVALSAAIWAIEVSVYVAVAAALDLDVPPIALAVVMSILTLGLTVPSAPGFVGVFEALVIPGLGLFGVAAGAGAAFALLLHVIHFLPGTALGLAAAWSMGLGLRDLRREEPKPSGAPL